MKKVSSSSEDEDWETPKPFYQLLAEKARRRYTAREGSLTPSATASQLLQPWSETRRRW